MNKPYLKDGQNLNTFGLRRFPEEKVNVWPDINGSSSSGVSFSCPNYFLCFTFLLLCQIGLLMGHPQCLDYGPPFQPPLHLEFCSAYEKFGCCDQEKDNSIAAKYWEIMDYISPQGHRLCGRYIKDILCQVGQMVSTCVHYWFLLGGDLSVLSLLYIWCCGVGPNVNYARCDSLHKIEDIINACNNDYSDCKIITYQTPD